MIDKVMNDVNPESPRPSQPEVTLPSVPARSMPTAGRHAVQPPQTGSELIHTSQSPQWEKGPTAVGHAMEDALKGETTEALSQNQSEPAQEILDKRENATLENVVDTLSDEQKRNMVETGEGPLIPSAVAQVVIEQGLSLDQVRTGLLIKYPEARVNEIMREVGVLLSDRGHEVPKEDHASSPEAEEAKLTEDEKTKIQALKNNEEVKALAEQAREALKNPAAMSDEKKKEWLSKVKELFDGKTSVVLGKAVKYTTIGVGVFAIIMIFLMAMHFGGGKGR